MLRYIKLIYSITSLIFSFFILVIPVSFLALIYKDSRRRVRLTGKYWNLFFKFILNYVTFTTVYKEDNRDAKDKVLFPRGLYICNHQSYMDIPLLSSIFIIPPIMKKELLYIPFFGVACYSSGAIIVNRSKHKSRLQTFNKATDRLKTEDGRLQYYPEGTRQKDMSKGPKELKKIKTKLIKFAYEHKIPVYPISIYGTNKILNKNGTINYNKKVALTLFKPRLPEDYESAEEFIKIAWDDVLEGYKRLEEKFK